jgi:AAHS family 4-hydroxybenzoate transporter-like MFS transporter
LEQKNKISREVVVGSVVDIGAIIDKQKIGRFQLTLLVISYLLLVTDGFDLGAAGFAGPGILKEWGLGGRDLGLLFSSSIAAGFFGPPIFGFLADRLGRKRVIVCGTVLFGCLTLATVLATHFYQLLLMRVLAGIALAGMLPIVVTLNCEFAPARFRATLVMLVFTGVTFGGALPGFVAAHYMASHGWRILFLIGGIAPLALALLLAYGLPESPKYLALRPHRRSELVGLLRKICPDLQVPDDATFAISGEENQRRFSLGALFSGRLLLLTPLFWISNLVAVMGVYFMNQLLPTILSTSGVSIADAAFATTLFQLGGTAGCLVSMRFLDRVGFLPVPIFFALSIPLVMSIGTPALSHAALLAIVFGAGFCLLGAQLGNIGTEGNIYPTFIRSSGVGSMFAVGRIGGGLGPLAGGFAMSAQVPVQHIFYALAVPLFLGCLATGFAVPLYRRHVFALSNQAASGSAGALSGDETSFQVAQRRPQEAL